MLKYIDIRNLAIIEQLSLPLKDKLTVITGETGAGKSIMVDALKLALGQRADQRWLKDKDKKGEITVTFDINANKAAIEWLDNHDLNPDGECMIRRVIHPQKSSRCFINQVPCPLNVVREFSQLLVTIHSQHEYQNLLKPEIQREMVDDFGENSKQLEIVKEAFQKWNTAKSTLVKLEKQKLNQDERIKLLTYQLEELNDLGLIEGEVVQLEAEHRQLAHAEELCQNSQSAIEFLTENEELAANSLIANARDKLNAVTKYTQDDNLTNIVTILESAQAQISEASHELQSELNKFEWDPKRLREAESRLDTIYKIARKHRVEPENLFELYQNMSEELASYKSLETQIESQTSVLEITEKEYLQAAELLSDMRKKSGQELAKATTDKLQQLAMLHARFSIIIHKTEAFSEFGIDNIQFIIATTLDHDPQPLDQVASGGELSRISLAIAVLTHQNALPTTFIFDEVDTGIGGKTATIVGQLVNQLASDHQVLCITHLPQIACFGNNHIRVQKTHKEKTTNTSLQTLTEKERIDEIARMLGGFDVTNQSLAHAKELLSLVTEQA